MKYDFDTIYDRRRSDAGKWAVGPDELPMWVADMDFKTAPEVISAMQERLDHGIFGYGDVPDEWYQAYISWWKRRHGFEIKKEWLVFCTGVVPAISSAVRKLT
ncbi:MAG: cystathionine beta-lyase, partial [Lachnospiraceae bacterium]|nr:cystathionine beta-lyase [Lachnospiraceae bacterium]